THTGWTTRRMWRGAGRSGPALSSLPAERLWATVSKAPACAGAAMGPTASPICVHAISVIAVAGSGCGDQTAHRWRIRATHKIDAQTHGNPGHLLSTPVSNPPS